jgi:DnaD/phage-associated family protein
MKKFKGFPPGKVRQIDVPAPFFSELLPLIDDLAELKVTLFCIWALQQKEGKYRYLRRRDFMESKALLQGLAVIQPEGEPESMLAAALQRAVERESLLCGEVALDTGTERLYFGNTVQGRAAVRQLRAGQWKPGDLKNPVEILPERPNIYTLYEDNIGLLTPMIADALKDAERDYPTHWLEEAVQEAVAHNKRSWRYIQAILRRWETEGKSRETTGQPDQPDGRRYITGKYADFLEH